ncbi:MAG: SusC/RagA family TonB-linked outer membrane protein [Bacteroidota bacterium]
MMNPILHRINDTDKRKWIMRVNVTTLLLVFSMMQVSASSFAQKVTLSEKNVPITKLFTQIKSQTGYDFVFTTSLFKNSKLVTIHVKNAGLSEVLSKVLDKEQMEFSIEEKSVIISKKVPSFLDRMIDRFRAIDVKGKILDENGAPLVGATVTVKGTNRVAKTDQNGAFFLSGIDEKAVLVISYIGYEPREVEAASDMGSLMLNLADAKLEEVTVNAGYYTVKDKERTGSISRITSKDIEKQPVNNPLLALQNRVPGLQIVQQTGISGGGISVQIRGRSSINTQVGNDPLYVVDNVVFPSNRVSPSLPILGAISAGASPLSMINPLDIESIEILKDADATAIYGSRGANGVILIKTKKGNTGKMKVNANVIKGYSQVSRKLDILNTEDYLSLRNEAYFTNDKLLTTSPQFATQYDLNGTWDKDKYTDWQEELIGGTAANTNISIGLGAGTEKMSYLIGGNYYKEGTVFPGDFGFKRSSVHSSLNYGTEKDAFNLAFYGNYIHNGSKLMSEDITPSIFLAPNAPNLYDENEQINWSDNTVYVNPAATLLKKAISNSENLITNLNFSWKILDGLAFKTSLGYNDIKRTDNSITPLTFYPPAFELTKEFRESYHANTTNQTIMAEPQFSYKTKLGIGDLDALIGMTIQSNDYRIQSIYGSGFNTDGILNNIAAAASTRTTLINLKYRYNAVFGRINYNIQSKYIFNLTSRRDGSSRFGEDKQFANFGAVGAAWLFSEEGFIKKNFPLLSFGKLRASYGLTGNDQIQDYQYLQLWTSGSSYQGQPTVVLNNLGNKEFAWETNRKTEVALQIGLFKDKLNFETSWYKNRSSNQLVGDPLPLSTGSTSIIANRNATVDNSGFEILVNFKVLNKQNWKWNLGMNLTIPKNKLISYPALESSADAYKYIIGEPLTIKRVYNVRGVDRETGLYNIEDKDGNGILNDLDRYVNKFTGTYYYGGFQNALEFKSISLDFLVSFNKQNASINYMNSNLYPVFFAPDAPLSNYPSIVLQRWQKSGDDTTIPKVRATFGSYKNYSDARDNGGESITDGSFVRLKNVSLNYNLPKRWINRMKITNAKVSLTGQNLFTYTNYIGLDPETQTFLNVPSLRTLALGLNITL